VRQAAKKVAVHGGDQQMFGPGKQATGRRQCYKEPSPQTSVNAGLSWGATALSPACEDKMDLEYTLIDCTTGLTYGPYETFHQARETAEGLERWEIINRLGNLVDWSPIPSTVLTATELAA
jgi:hypothetical protein